MLRLLIRPYDLILDTVAEYVDHNELFDSLVDDRAPIPPVAERALRTNGYGTSQSDLGWLKHQGPLTYNVSRLSNPPAWGFFCVKMGNGGETVEVGFVLREENFDATKIAEYELRLVKGLDALDALERS